MGTDSFSSLERRYRVYPKFRYCRGSPAQGSRRLRPFVVKYYGQLLDWRILFVTHNDFPHIYAKYFMGTMLVLCVFAVHAARQDGAQAQDSKW